MSRSCDHPSITDFKCVNYPVGFVEKYAIPLQAIKSSQISNMIGQTVIALYIMLDKKGDKSDVDGYDHSSSVPGSLLQIEVVHPSGWLVIQNEL